MKRTEVLARSLAPEAWAALEGRDTKGHAARRASSTAAAAVLDVMQRTATRVPVRDAYQIGSVTHGCDRTRPGSWASTHLKALVRLGLVERLSGPGWIGTQYRLTAEGLAYAPDVNAVPDEG